MKTCRVLLADHNTLFREGLAQILASKPDFCVAGQAGNSQEVAAKSRALKPDLILMGILWPDRDGLRLVRQVKHTVPQATIIVLTSVDDRQTLFRAVRSGARGYIPKTIESRDMIGLLRAMLHGGIAILPARIGLRRRALIAPREGAIVNAHGVAVALTTREQEVLGHVASGAKDREIAETLHISVLTVKSHMRNILAKLAVCSRHEAAQLLLTGSPISTDAE